MEEKETAKGGIIIPDTAKEKPQEGEVMAVGAGKIEKGKRVPLDVKVGDRILFGKYTGSEIKIDDQEYLILREEEILAKLLAGSPRQPPPRNSFIDPKGFGPAKFAFTQEGEVQWQNKL